ncbi:MAG: patatin-like phospholipase family protein, partial [Fusobacteriaceae bacterium]
PIFLIPIFIFIFSTSFSIEVNSKKEILDSLDSQIEILLIKQEQIKKLKKIIEARKFDITDPNIKNKNPKIALVLSGGGAKGAAHIGVLKVLEKHKIPIDIVVGTSVGSIVGGMYSIGYTPEEIESIVLNINFDTIINNSVNRDLQNVERKFDTNKYPLSFNIKKDFELSIPMGLVNGQNIYFQLKKIFSRANKTKNFDDFPRQFRAVTTELQSGKEVILSSGDLALATFKSMAIPSFIEPVNDNGIYYVDGGLVNNFPVDVALSLGADIIIAVDIAAETALIDNNSNIVTILDKISTYSGNKNSEDNKKLANIVITPNVKSHNTVDFDNLEPLILAGEKAALESEKILSTLSNKVKFDKIANNKLIQSENSISENNIELIGNKILTYKTVLSLKPNIGSKELTEDDLEKWTEKIYSLEYVSKIYYEVKEDKIIFNIKENDNINLNFALNYSSDIGPSIRTGIELKTLNSFSSSYYLDLSLSQYPDVFIKNNYSYNLSGIKLISAFELGYESKPLLFWKKGKNISTFNSQNLSANFSLATAPTNNSIFGVYFKYNNIKNLYKSGDRSFPFSTLNENTSYVKSSAFLILDTLNSDSYPTKGLTVFGEVYHSNRDLLKNNDFTGYTFSNSYFYPLSKKLSLGVSGTAIGISGSNIPLNERPTLGGLRTIINNSSISFYGLSQMQRYLEDAYITSFQFKYNLIGSLNFIAKYNYALIDYNQKLSELQDSKKQLSGYGGGIGWDTFLGPMDFILSNDSENGGFLFNVYIGYIF